MANINILLVDDHSMVRSGIKRILNGMNGVKIIGEADNGEEAIQIARKKQPHLVLMDIKMPTLNGIETSKKLHRLFPDIRILLLTSLKDEPTPARALQIEGVSGYLTKDATSAELEQAIYAIYNGQRFIDTRLAQELALTASQEKTDNPFNQLSERELEVVHMLMAGTKVLAIAEALGVSPKTVNSFRYRVFEKLNINSDVQLTHLAVRYGIIKESDTK